MRQETLVFRISQIIRAVERQYGMDEMDASARNLLFLIGEAERDGSSLSVSEAIRESGTNTAPTVYSKLAKLEASGWVKSVPDKNDRRVKRLHLTPHSKKVFGVMSRLVRSDSAKWPASGVQAP